MHLSELNIYPVKSLKGIPLNEALVEGRGLQYDRRWMIVDENNKFITQREVPQMALVRIDVGSDGMRAAMNGNSIEVPLDPKTGDMAPVGIWEGPVDAEFYPQEFHNWFTGALGVNCKLVGMPSTTNRVLPREYAIRETDVVSFADGYPFLLISEATLDDLNGRLESPVPMNRFRPNFVVNGSGPFEEDTWKRIRIGSTEFHLVKPCARCVMTTVDQTLGQKDGKEPLATLSQYRTRDGKVLFGQNLIAEKPGGTVRVGDPVEVLERW